MVACGGLWWLVVACGGFWWCMIAVVFLNSPVFFLSIFFSSFLFFFFSFSLLSIFFFFFLSFLPFCLPLFLPSFFPSFIPPEAYCSDSVSCDIYPNSFPFPVQRYGYDHVGQVAFVSRAFFTTLYSHNYRYYPSQRPHHPS